MRKSVCSLNDKNEHFYQCRNYFQQSDAVAETQTVNQILSMLTETQRETVRLYLLEEIPIEDIASDLGVSKKTVYSRIHYAQKRLKENAVFFKKL